MTRRPRFEFEDDEMEEEGGFEVHWPEELSSDEPETPGGVILVGEDD